jgi:hypothetical protein
MIESRNNVSDNEAQAEIVELKPERTKRRGVIIRAVIAVIVIVVVIGACYAILMRPSEEGAEVVPPENRRPVAVIDVDRNVIYEGESVNFSGAESYDDDDDMLEFYWDFDDTVDQNGDGIYNNDNESTVKEPLPHTYWVAGTYTATLVVFDGKLYSKPATQNIEVRPKPTNGQNHSAILEPYYKPAGLLKGDIYGFNVVDSTKDELQNITYLLIDNETKLPIAEGLVSEIKSLPGVVTFIDSDMNERLTQFDQFEIDTDHDERVSEGDIFRLIYYYTGELMCEAYLTKVELPPPR